MRAGRPLIQTERELLASFAGAVDLDRIRIYDRGTPFGRLVSVLARGAAVALGHRIVVSGPVYLPTLAHELAHVSQYTRWGPARYFLAGFWNQIVLRILLGRDVYRWEFEPGKLFHHYGMEQQGQIVEDCYDVASPRRAHALLISPFTP